MTSRILVATVIALCLSSFVYAETLPTYITQSLAFTTGHSYTFAKRNNTLFLGYRDSPNASINKFDLAFNSIGSFALPTGFDALGLAVDDTIIWAATINGQMIRFNYTGTTNVPITWSPGWTETDVYQRDLSVTPDHRLLYPTTGGARLYTIDGTLIRTYPMQGTFVYTVGVIPLPGGGVVTSTWVPRFVLGIYDSSANLLMAHGQNINVIQGMNTQENYLEWNHIAADRFGNIYIAQMNRSNTLPGFIYKVAPEGVLLWTLTTSLPNGQACTPNGIVVDGQSIIYANYRQLSNNNIILIKYSQDTTYHAWIQGTIRFGDTTTTVPCKVIVRRMGSLWQINADSGVFSPFEVYPSPARYVLQAIPLDTIHYIAGDTIVDSLAQNQTHNITLNLARNVGVLDYENKKLPERFSISVFPNPFNTSTQIQLNVLKACRVQVSVYDLLGYRIVMLADRNYQVGMYRIEWNGNNNNGVKMPSGIYFISMRSPTFETIQKVAIMK